MEAQIYVLFLWLYISKPNDQVFLVQYILKVEVWSDMQISSMFPYLASTTRQLWMQ